MEESFIWFFLSASTRAFLLWRSATMVELQIDLSVLQSVTQQFVIFYHSENFLALSDLRINLPLLRSLLSSFGLDVKIRRKIKKRWEEFLRHYSHLCLLLSHLFASAYALDAFGGLKFKSVIKISTYGAETLIANEVVWRRFSMVSSS